MDFPETESLNDEESEPDSDLPIAHLAAANGETVPLTQAIRDDPSTLEQQDAEGLTPLGHAVLAGQPDSMKLLVKMGAAINCQDHLGRTPLAMAAYQGWHDGVVFLLRNGAKQNICDRCGRSPLHAATYDLSTRCMESLLQSLPEEGINYQDNEGMTALHWACFHNRPDHVRLLLTRGADVLAQDVDGRSGLHWAAQNGSVVCCEYILSHPQGAALVNQVDITGKTAHHFAAAAGRSEVIRRLVQVQGCDLNADDPDERTALHWAAATGQTDTVNTLLELGAEPNPIDAEGATPLDYARQSGHQECARLLETRLGISPSEMAGDAQSAETHHVESNPANRGRRNPFGFIVDFFKPKKARSSSDTGECSHDAGLDSHPRTSLIQDQAREHSTDSVHTSTGSRDSNGICISPRKRSETEVNVEIRIIPRIQVIQSLEKIHLSREDNPCVQNQRKLSADSRISLLANDSPRSDLGGNRNLLAAQGGGDLRRVSADSVDHSYLIRSPPPALKRESLSPVRNTLLTPRTEVSPHQVAEDAAEILALQRGGVNSLPHGFRSPSLPPLSPIENKNSSNGGSGAKRQKHRLSTDATPSSLNASPPQEGVGGAGGQLGPIKGPVPRVQGGYSSGNLVNKQLEAVRKEPWGPNRSPTPPNWDHPLASREPSQGGSPSHTESGIMDSSPSNSKGKGKRKKRRSLQTDSPSHLSSMDQEGSSTASEAPPLVPIYKEHCKQRLSIDKNMGLLH